MLARYPEPGRRRAKELYQELEAIASVLVPEWRGAELEGQFGSALLRIAAHLGGHVTSRIDATPRRDVLAFFDMLDVPFDGPRPARAPLVFLLSEKRNDPVFAPAATQVAASSDDGEVVFETTSALHLAPGRLRFLASADGDRDRIAEAPPGFLELAAPPGPLPALRAASFARAGRSTLQVEPGEGLKGGDVIRISSRIYRIKEAKDGLLRLRDTLEADVLHESVIQKVTGFDPFSFRDLQAHILYVGHKELLNLEAPSAVQVFFEPPGVAARLVDLGLIWELYGTDEDKPEESERQGWQPLTSSLGKSGEILLAKAWAGSIDEVEVNGLGSRWLRARYPIDVLTTPVPETRTSEIQLKVKTLDKQVAARIQAAKGDREGCKTVPKIVKPGDDGSVASSAALCDEGEGSRTIDQAFHNATPLPLTTRFLPFGPEPQRFDTFALAAPEALSKTGAIVTFDVRLPDATIQAMEVAQTTDGPFRAYGISANGRLQGLAFNDNQVEWGELGQPELTDSETGSDVRLRDLELDGAVAPQAIQLATTATTTDLVVALDRRGHPWVTRAVVTSDDRFERQAWKELPAVPGDSRPCDLVLLRRANPGLQPRFAALLLAVGADELQRMTLAVNGDQISASDWDVVPHPVTDQPDFGNNSRLAQVAPAAWPATPAGFPVDIVIADDHGALWLGSIQRNHQNVLWDRLIDPPDPRFAATSTIRPAAARLPDNNNWIVFAARDNGGIFETFITRQGEDPVSPNSTFEVAPDSSLQICNRTPDQEPLALVFGTKGDGVPTLALSSSKGIFLEVDVPQDIGLASPPCGFLVPRDGALTLVAAGKAETLHLESLAEEVEFEIFHALERASPLADTHFLQLKKLPTTDRSVVEVPLNPVISNTGSPATYLYPILEVAEPETGGDLKLYRQLAAAFNSQRLAPRELVRAAGDNLTVDTHHVVINDHIFKVTATTGGKITVDADLPDTVAEYTTVEAAGTVSFETQHEKTLVRLAGAHRDLVNPQYLVFSGQAEPPPAPSLAQAARHFPTSVPALTTPPSVLSQTVTSEHWWTPLWQQFLLSPNVQLNLLPPQPARQVIRLAAADWVWLKDAWTIAPATSARLQVVGVDTGNWQTTTYERGYQNPELAWEYFDGDSWRRLEGVVDGTGDLAKSEEIVFKVPDDLEQGEIAGQEDYWVRARLVGGDFGRAQYIVTSVEGGNNTTTQAVVVDTSSLLPPEILCIEASFVLEDAATPQHILVKNNLGIRDQTQANQVADAEFELFEGVRKINQAGTPRVLYFGFTKPFDVSPLSMFVDAEDQEDAVDLDFEVLAGDGWRRVSADDETCGFHRRGFVQLSIDVEPRQAALFGQELHWLRARPGPGTSAENWAPRLLGVFINASLAEQAKTLEQEVLGSSPGEPGLTLTLGNQPVLPNSIELRVRETLSDEERDELNRDQLNRDQDRPVTRYPELSLPGDWVLWERVDSFVEHDSDARVYRLDPVSGDVTFGARTPPAGADSIRAIQYQTGGGERGNVEAFEVKSLKSAVEAVDVVANPVPAVGGNNAPGVEAELANAPGRLRRARHALTPPDFEALAVSTSPDVVRARCLFPESPGGPIRVAVAMRTGERCPHPSLAEREALASTLREQAWGALSEDGLEVVVPEYMRTRLATRLRAVSTDQAAALEQAAVRTLRLLLHPVAVGAGPSGRGWPFARRIYESDVLRALAALPGLDRVEHLDLSPVDKSQDFDEMSPLSLICAEETDIEVKVAVDEQGT